MKTALLILILMAPSLAFAQAPSLADAARKERERQKNATSSATFTNESLGIPVLPPPAPPSPDDAAKSGAKSAPNAAPNTASKAIGAATAAATSGHDEAWWRDAFKTAREEIQRSEDRAKVLQLELNQLNMDLLTRSDIYNRESVLPPQINKKNEELAAAQRDADLARQKVAKLEEDLRREGGPAGWAR